MTVNVPPEGAGPGRIFDPDLEQVLQNLAANAAVPAHPFDTHLPTSATVGSNADVGEVTLSWGTPGLDPDGWWSGGAPTDFVVPETGVYLISSQIAILDDNQAARQLWAKVHGNGPSHLEFIEAFLASEASGELKSLPLHKIVSLAGGQVLQVVVHNGLDTGQSITVRGGSGEVGRTFFTAHRVA